MAPSVSSCSSRMSPRARGRPIKGRLGSQGALEGLFAEESLLMVRYIFPAGRRWLPFSGIIPLAFFEHLHGLLGFLALEFDLGQDDAGLDLVGVASEDFPVDGRCAIALLSADVDPPSSMPNFSR